MRPILLSLLVLVLFPALLCQGQERPSRVYRNAISGEFPVYTAIGGYPGISLGLNYERLLNRSGSLAAGMDFQHVWGGTFAHGELRNGEARANLKADYFAPGIFYYPTKSRPGANLGIGVSFPVGNIRRFDATGRFDETIYTPVRRDFFAAAVGQVNMTVRSESHFAFTIFVNYGRVLSGGPTSGSFGQVGLRYAGLF